MSSKSKTAKHAPHTIAHLGNQKSNSPNLIPLFIIALYLLVDFVPEWGGVDVIGSQWLYLVMVNAIGFGYIAYFYKAHHYEPRLKQLLSQSVPLSYLALFILAGLSIFFATNPTEGWVCYAYFITTLLAFFNIALLLSGNKNNLKLIAQAVAVILFIQSVSAISTYLNGMNESILDDLVLAMKGNTGNKNIFAASVAIKVSFVIYCIYALKSSIRFLYIPILALGTICLLLINARAAYLSLLLQVGLFLIFISLKYFKQRNVKEGIIHLSTVIVPVVLSFLIAQALLSHTKQSSASSFNSIGHRIESIASTTAYSNAARLKLWTSGFDYIKKHPLMGAGYGNCKIEIVPYEHQFASGFEFNQHLHNDFIETAMELGLLGGLLFASIFIGVLIGVIKIWRSKKDEQSKTIAFFALMALSGYFVDALFNFPCERPIMQLLFALILAIFVSTTLEVNPQKPLATWLNRSYVSPMIACLGIVLILVAGYYRYNTYQSLVAQSLTIPDFPNKATHSWAEINDKLPDVPNLDANNIAVDVVKAWYLSQEGKFPQALDLLNKSTKVNPYNQANEFIKARIFLQTHQMDSAFYYANKGFQTRPSNIGFYAILNDIYRFKKDTTGLKNIFLKCIARLPTVAVWDQYISALMGVGYPQERLQAVLQAGLKQFPNDKGMQEKELVIKATQAMNGGNTAIALKGFVKLAELNPTRHDYIENAGVCYFALKKYEQALPYLDQVIAAKAFNNGKAEYFKGLCLYNLGQKPQGCSYLQLASAKNYPDAAKLSAVYCR